MYLGVHTPLDVGVSFVLAALLVWLLRGLPERGSRSPRLMRGVFLLMLVLALGQLLFALCWPFPADADPALIRDAAENAAKIFGAALGAALGYEMDVRYLHFDTRACWWAQGLKLLLGLALALAIKSGLKEPLVALMGGHTVPAGILRYFLLTAFACALWPMTFHFFGRLGKK